MTSPIPPWAPGHTPYVTPDQLISGQWPTGVAWGTLPDTSQDSPPTPPQNFAVIAMICQQATSAVQQILNQPAHAEEPTEEYSGPDFRVTVDWSSGNGRIIASRWPVTQVVLGAGVAECRLAAAVDVAAVGTPNPSTRSTACTGRPRRGRRRAGYPVRPRLRLLAVWLARRAGLRARRFRVAFTYLAGWPHTSLTAAADAGAETIDVDECTGWLLTGTNGGTVGAMGIIYDATGGGQEPVTVTQASETTGPGTLTLSSALQYAHGTGIMVSALPPTIIWATALLAAASADTRGVTATTIQTLGAREQGVHPLEAQARHLLNTFRRTI